MIYFFIGIFVSLVIICWAWATGIDNMKEKHPDYKGEDFLNWDDDKVHTEDKI
jgi:hypothetical protein